MTSQQDNMTTEKIGKKGLVLGTLDSIRFNIMVAGVGGIGKSTFLKLFFQRYRKDGTESTLQLNNRAKTVKTLKIEEIGRFVLDADNVQVDFHLIDTPGFGDSINNQHAINNVKRYIERAHKEWSELDNRSMSRQEMNAADKRIHCIFYFIPAHRMKVIDSEFIVQLATLAPIVPIIAKSDTMTYQERKDYLVEIQSIFSALKSQTTYPILFDFKESPNVGFIPDLSASSNSPQVRTRQGPLDAKAKTVSAFYADLQGVNYDSQPEEEEEGYELHTVSSGEGSDNKPIEGLEGTTLGSYFYSAEEFEDSTLQSQRKETPEEKPAAQPLCDIQEKDTLPSHPTLPRIPNVFAVVCDTNPNGLREFPYGTLEIYNKEHSDFRRLQELFFESGEHILKMRRQTEQMSIQIFKESRKVTAWQKALLMALHETKLVLNQVLLFLSWTALLLYLFFYIISLGDTTQAWKYIVCIAMMLNKLMK